MTEVIGNPEGRLSKFPMILPALSPQSLPRTLVTVATTCGGPGEQYLKEAGFSRLCLVESYLLAISVSIVLELETSLTCGGGCLPIRLRLFKQTN